MSAVSSVVISVVLSLATIRLGGGLFLLIGSHEELVLGHGRHLVRLDCAKDIFFLGLGLLAAGLGSPRHAFALSGTAAFRFAILGNSVHAAVLVAIAVLFIPPT